MHTRKALFQIFCLGIILIQINSMFLKENDCVLTSGDWKDSCAEGATKVSETGESIGESATVANNDTTGEEIEQPVANATSTNETDTTTGGATTLPAADMNATTGTGESGVADNKTSENRTSPLQQRKILRSHGDRRASRKAQREAARAERKAARKAEREASRRKSSGEGICKAGKKVENNQDDIENRTTLRQTIRPAEGNITENVTEPIKASNATTDSMDNIPTTGEKKSQLDDKLQDLIGSIKDFQDVTIKKIDELKDSEILNIGGKKGAPITSDENITKGAADNKTQTNEGKTGNEGRDEVLPDNKTTITSNETTGVSLKAGADGSSDMSDSAGADGSSDMSDSSSDDKSSDMSDPANADKSTDMTDASTISERDDCEIIQDSADGPRMTRPMSPCKLKRRLERRLRRQERLRARDEERDCASSQLIQKQWDLLENMKDTPPTISNAISEACSIVKAKASENSRAQGISEHNSTQSAKATGTGDSISVANSIGTTNSKTHVKALENSNSIGVTQSNTNGNSNSNADTGSVSIANNKNTNLNSNELRAEKDSNSIGRVLANSNTDADSTASQKSLSSSNSIDNVNARSRLTSQDSSIGVGNTAIASNAKSTSTSTNGSKAQSVSESLGDGNTDLTTKTSSRAVGNLDLTSSSEATADSVNGGNTISTANSKTCGANEGTAENNSTILLNNRNSNQATSSSSSSGTLEAAQGMINRSEINQTEPIEQPTGVQPLRGGRLRSNVTNETEQVAGTGEEESQTDKEEVKDVDSVGIANVTEDEIKAANVTEDSTKKEDICDMSDMTMGAGKICDFSDMSLDSKKESGKEISLGEGIFKGDAHTKNICRHMCQNMGLPRVTRAEIKSGNDGLTIFRCLCGNQFTSWYKPKYPAVDLTDDTSAKLSRKEKRRAERRNRREQRRALRQKKGDLCSSTSEESSTSEYEKKGTPLKLVRSNDNQTSGTSLGAGRSIDNKTSDIIFSTEKKSQFTGISGSTDSCTPTVDMKPVVNDFIDNNVNSIKTQNANYLNKVQDLLASKTGSSSSKGGC